MEDFSLTQEYAPIVVGAAAANIINDSRLYIDNITSLPPSITESGVPEYTFLDSYYNRRQNISAGQSKSLNYGDEFEFCINIDNNAFLGEAKIQFTTPAVCLNNRNKWGRNGYLCKTRDFAFNIFEYLHYKIDDDQKVLGELSSDLMISNTYFDLKAGLREALYAMVGNSPSQIEPHGVDNFIPEYTYILPLKNCFNEDFANRFPIASLGITKTLKICGKLRCVAELFILGNSTLINQVQPVVFIRNNWLTSRHGENQCIKEFNLYYKTSRVPDFDLNTMIFGGQQRNICLEVFDPLPFYHNYDASIIDGNRYHLGAYANIHHIFFGIKNISNPAEGSVYTLLRPQLAVAPTNGPNGLLGRLKFNPNNDHSVYEYVEFTYNGISEIINWRDMQLFNPYEVCESTPAFHTRGLGLKCFDPFNLHPKLRSMWPNGNMNDVFLKVVPSREICEKFMRSQTIVLEEFFEKGENHPVTNDVLNDDTYIPMNFSIDKPRFKIFCDVVTVRIFRIEQGTICPVPIIV